MGRGFMDLGEPEFSEEIPDIDHIVQLIWKKKKKDGKFKGKVATCNIERDKRGANQRISFYGDGACAWYYGSGKWGLWANSEYHFPCRLEIIK